MTTTHEQLRALAEAAQRYAFEPKDYSPPYACKKEFRDALTPSVVLALLDELAASKEANWVALGALTSTQDFDTLTVGDCLDKVEAAITQLKEVLK